MNTTSDFEHRFKKDIENHVMTIVSSADGLRHLRCAEPNTSMQSFEVTTTRQHLFYTGDMGTFVFRKHELDDLFKYFRGNMGGSIEITGDKTTFDLADYKKVVLAELHDLELIFVEDDVLTNEKLTILSECRELVSYVTDEWEAVACSREIGDKLAEDHCDWYECVNNAGWVLTGRFKWAREAIRWAIAEYDKQVEVK